MLNDGHGIAIAAICGTGMFCCLFMLILILMYRRLKSIMVSSPTFCCIQLLGILMGYLACLMYVGKPNPAICVAREFIITTGFILVVGSLIAKSYRYLDGYHLMQWRMLTLKHLLGYTKCKTSCFLCRHVMCSCISLLASKMSSQSARQGSNQSICYRLLQYVD